MMIMDKVKGKPKNREITLPSSVAIVYSDVQRSYFPSEAQYITEKGAEGDARLIGEYLATLGMRVALYPGNAELTGMLRLHQPEMVINLVDSVRGKESLAAALPGVFELLEIPYTGANILGLSLDTNKFLIKKMYQQHGIPVPHYQLFLTAQDALDPTLRFPLISKLNAIHGSVEITQEAVSENEKQLRKRIGNLIRIYRQPVLVEEFISGRELTAIIVHEKKKVVYIAEKKFAHPDAKYVFLTFEDQWLAEANAAFHYQKYLDPLLVEYVRRAFNVSEMADYGKFDIRLDQSGRYYFIDSNCNPAMGPKELDVALSVILDLYGISFYEFLKKLIVNTLRDQKKKARKITASEENGN